MTQSEEHDELIAAGYIYDGRWTYTKHIYHDLYVDIPAMGSYCAVRKGMYLHAKYLVRDFSPAELARLEEYARIVYNLWESGFRQISH